ncbi:MAG TPA: CPBP family glutamic-type intramembrane protease [Kouleothrix sp.]|uniref:CPBP family glutamic-type intramembrane protease n=1 Tax=Kouleothrix sp. TaxID=2779161 RepID=UPI002C1EFA4B|nr:CPBP family glutamic-type intramembrane protease [Kouleothrix sp.]
MTTWTVRQTRRPIWLLWGYLLLITIAELCTSLVNPQLGLLLHALLLVGLTFYGATGQLDENRKLALALTLAPLIRLLSLSLPLTRFPQIAWYPIVALPLFLAAWIVIRLLGISRQTLGLRAGNLPLQLMIIGGGLGLGAIEFAILRPAPLVASLAPGALWLPALSLIVCTGFSEELIFRGLLQPVATPALGRWALMYVALLFAVLHIGYLSLSDVLFVFVVGLLFGYIVRWGGSILGVSLAHGLTNITLFLILPYLSRNPGLLSSAMPWAIAAGSAMAILAISLLMWRGAALRMPLPRTLPAFAPRPAAPAAPKPKPAANQPLVANLRLRRQVAGITYVDLAQRTGLPARLLAEIEHGLRLPQPEQIQLIVSALGAA